MSGTELTSDLIMEWAIRKIDDINLNPEHYNRQYPSHLDVPSKPYLLCASCAYASSGFKRSCHCSDGLTFNDPDKCRCCGGEL